MNIRKENFTILFLLIILPIFAQDYYPLHVKDTWVYQHYDVYGSPSEWVDKITVSEYDDQNEIFLINQTMKLSEMAPVISSIVIDKRANYILIIGSRGGLLNKDWEDKTETILKLPLKIGLTWQNEIAPDIVSSSEVISKTNLVSANEIFNDVFVIKEIRSSLNPKDPKSKPLIHYFYYAPNIGMLKHEIDTEKERILFESLIQFNNIHFDKFVEQK